MTSRKEKNSIAETLIPNRFADVDAICRAHPESFPPGDANDPSRLALLTGTMVPQINHDHPEDKGNWGVLTKTDQGGKVPCDVMVWKPGTVTVDVMTGTGASWGWYTVRANNPAWVWTAVGGTVPTPVPPQPPSGGTIPYDEAKSIQFGQACNAVYAESGAPIDPGMISVHSQRCAYDYYVMGMSWDACLKKHTNEFRAVYGLPPLP